MENTDTSIGRFSDEQQGTAATFLHRPLDDAHSEIRLLQIRSSGNGDAIELQCFHCRLCEAPPFNAISYTWGAPRNEVPLLINGKRFKVRPNCYHALWQARVLQDGGLIWLDSICINQSDDKEKSMQVSIMWEIYRRASTVLVCLGPHYDDSKFLFEAANSPIYWDIPSIVTPEWVEKEWLPKLSASKALRIWNAFVSFSRRPYWRRLWIVQELAAQNRGRSPNIGILCGSSSITWGVCGIVMYLCQSIRKRPYDYGLPIDSLQVEATPVHVLEKTARVGMSLLNTLLMFGRFKCYDPRDRIYGVLGFVDWKQEKPRIAPDYTKTTFDVALQAILHTSFCDSPAVLDGLMIDCDNPQMQSLVLQRTVQQEVSQDSFPTPVLHRAVLDVAGHIYQDEAYAPLIPLHFSREGIFNAVLFVEEPKRANEHIDEDELLKLFSSMREVGNELETRFAGRMPKIIVSNGNVAGFVCHEAQEGDYITCTGCFTGGTLLVIRPSQVSEDKIPRDNGEGHASDSASDDEEKDEEYLLDKAIAMSLEEPQCDKDINARFDLVGQGFMVAGHTFPDLKHTTRMPYTIGNSIKAAVTRARVEVQLTAEDMVLLTGQDLAAGERMGSERKFSAQARLLRLLTRPANYPLGAAYVRAITADELMAQKLRQRPMGESWGMIDI